MTQQVENSFLYDGHGWSILGESVDESDHLDDHLSLIFKELGVQPAGFATCCYAGYQAELAVLESRLVITTLRINLVDVSVDSEGRKSCKPLKGPPINGVHPKGPEKYREFLNNHYEGINYPLDYSGGIFLTNGIHCEEESHLWPYWGLLEFAKWDHVVELSFSGGILTGEIQIPEVVAAFVQDRPGIELPTAREVRDHLATTLNHQWSRLLRVRTWPIPDDSLTLSQIPPVNSHWKIIEEFAYSATFPTCVKGEWVGRIDELTLPELRSCLYYFSRCDIPVDFVVEPPSKDELEILRQLVRRIRHLVVDNANQGH